MDHCGSEVYISWTMNSCPEFWKSAFFPDVHGDGTTSLAPLSFQRWNVPHETPLASHPATLVTSPNFYRHAHTTGRQPGSTGLGGRLLQPVRCSALVPGGSRV
ncbi:hypothetical protein Naga_100477g6 [Nannochloropsis gaditana]|uniref:Uncharacterized protein n=1 Tax=Nannochloropsis gaditana TaxID=72520 RepID=W7U7Y3_9STRA|nr:hypothetical protein Naga_100477g6 [Nannochloropsis gaditana]